MGDEERDKLEESMGIIELLGVKKGRCERVGGIKGVEITNQVLEHFILVLPTPFQLSNLLQPFHSQQSHPRFPLLPSRFLYELCLNTTHFQFLRHLLVPHTK